MPHNGVRKLNVNGIRKEINLIFLFCLFFVSLFRFDDLVNGSNLQVWFCCISIFTLMLGYVRLQDLLFINETVVHHGGRHHMSTTISTEWRIERSVACFGGGEDRRIQTDHY